MPSWLSTNEHVVEKAGHQCLWICFHLHVWSVQHTQLCTTLPSALTIPNYKVCQRAAVPDLKSMMEVLIEIPPPAFGSIICKEKGKVYCPAVTAILHHWFRDSSQLWVVCSTPVIYQRIGGILFVTFMFPASRLKTNKYVLCSLGVMGGTDL